MSVAEAELPTNHQAEWAERTVTPGRRPGLSAAERKRQQRARDRGTLLFERPDWRLFLDAATLPQKAGCQPGNLRAIALREVVDNALDAGADDVTLTSDGDGSYTIADDGPGLDPGDVPRLFAVNRPLLSSKRRRLPLRGMLGNGLRVVMGAVAASDGTIVVETRGSCLTLAVDAATGQTLVLDDVPEPLVPGLTVRLTFGPLLPSGFYGSHADSVLARTAIALANHGKPYTGPSSPWWYSPRDLHFLMAQVSPADTTVARLCLELGFKLADDRLARTLSREDAAAILERLREGTKPVQPERLGPLGPGVYDGRCYAKAAGFTNERGAAIPFVAEAWAECSPSERRGDGSADVDLFLNRTPSLATILGAAQPAALLLRGCGLFRQVRAATGHYTITVSIISPHIDLATDGKEPALAPFGAAIAEVVRRACSAAHHQMDRPAREMSIKAAAWLVMADAYALASGGGQYPANARQIMYAARPRILELTGRSKLDDKYFTQTLLPDYIEEHPEQTAAWDVVFDARGHFIEPHTGRQVSLGTIEVRDYLGERVRPEDDAVAIDPGLMRPTSGPEHRFSAVLFVEKEGFGPLLEKARIAERFDLAIMSSKGMSTTAARLLLDRLAPRVDQVLVMHDFDVSGFSIFGTLGADGRRYQFRNEVPIADLGLRLADVAEMGLQAEPVETSGEWDKRAATLAEHGATKDEIAFLRRQRVELNAMPSDVFVAFLEAKLAEHKVQKVVPDADTLTRHARRVIVRELTNRVLQEIQGEAAAAASKMALPSDLQEQVAAMLADHPGIPWDIAVARIAQRACPDGTATIGRSP
jgi:hypothetical protein